MYARLSLQVMQFLPKNPIICGSCAENDLQLMASYGTSPPCKWRDTYIVPYYVYIVPYVPNMTMYTHSPMFQIWLCIHVNGANAQSKRLFFIESSHGKRAHGHRYLEHRGLCIHSRGLCMYTESYLEHRGMCIHSHVRNIGDYVYIVIFVT